MHGRALAFFACLGSLLLLPASAIYLSVPTPQVFAQQSDQLSQDQLRQVAESITVRIAAKHENAGSGILVGKQGQVYQVVTNAHVLTSGAPYAVKMPDGRVYPAERVKTVDFGRNDLGLLQFQSEVDYAVASLGRSSALDLNEPVFAAGFPSEADELVFNQGEFTQWQDRALIGGYQFGYTNEIQQGMSGGPVLNQQGEVVAINSLRAYPILNNAYVYEGEQGDQLPDEWELQQLRQSNWAVTTETFVAQAPGFDYACVASPASQQSNDFSTVSQSPIMAEVHQKSQRITVWIDGPQERDGSGVIIGKDGNVYTVLTAEHVVPTQAQDGKYDIVTSDNQRCPVNYRRVKKLPGADLAVLQFTSNRSYPVAMLASYKPGEDRRYVFVSGWLPSNPSNPLSQRLFTVSTGLLFGRESSPFWTRDFVSLTYGYELVYTNLTNPGMSGGPVLDTQGRVIGIHGRADGIDTIDQAGQSRPIQLFFSLGIPVSTFVNLAAKVELEPGILKQETSEPKKLTPSEEDSLKKSLLKNVEVPQDSTDAIAWLNYGNQLWRVLQFTEALDAFDQAIQLQPDFYQAWYARGLILQSQGQEQYQKAIESFDRAIQKSPPSFAPPWRSKGWLLSVLNKHQEALISFDKVLELDPKAEKEDFALHLLRGISLGELERYPEAIAAYTQAIKINPHPWAYNNRGNVYFRLEDYQKAIADYTQAIELNPDLTVLATAYYNRGDAYCRLGDEQTALKDFQQAGEFYQQQGSTKEYQEAITRDCQSS
jgi:tetratricopeptide (TPR) repeat protein/S1-C subfamily serine protease